MPNSRTRAGAHDLFDAFFLLVGENCAHRFLIVEYDIIDFALSGITGGCSRLWR